MQAYPYMLTHWILMSEKAEIGSEGEEADWLFMHSFLHPFKFTHQDSGSIIFVSVKKAFARTNFPKIGGQEERNPKSYVCLRIPYA